MKKVIKMENLECANCAAKMEAAIRKIDGVKEVSISFMLQKMTLEADNNVFDAVVEQAKKICKKIEPDCTLKI